MYLIFRVQMLRIGIIHKTINVIFFTYKRLFLYFLYFCISYSIINIFKSLFLLHKSSDIIVTKSPLSIKTILLFNQILRNLWNFPISWLLSVLCWFSTCIPTFQSHISAYLHIPRLQYWYSWKLCPHVLRSMCSLYFYLNNRVHSQCHDLLSWALNLIL